MKTENWKKKCEKVADETRIGLSFWEKTDNKAIYEDDGNLHIERHGIRVIFDVGLGQEVDGKSQNVNTAAVLSAVRVSDDAPETL